MKLVNGERVGPSFSFLACHFALDFSNLGQ